MFSNHVQSRLQSVVHFYLSFLCEDLNAASADRSIKLEAVEAEGASYQSAPSQLSVSSLTWQSLLTLAL